MQQKLTYSEDMKKQDELWKEEKEEKIKQLYQYN